MCTLFIDDGVSYNDDDDRGRRGVFLFMLNLEEE